jgi:hypothetical protein
MTDPVTVGGLAATALAMGAEAVLKGAVGEAVKDAYKAIKDKLCHLASGEIAALETRPSSNGLQIAVAEIIDAQSGDDKEAIRLLAETLVAKLKNNAQAIGVDIEYLTKLETHLRKVTVTQGVGVRIKNADGGKLEIDELNVGPSSGK